MYLKRLFTFITIVFSLLAFNPQPALASCAPPVSLAEYKEQADIVVLGRTTNVSDDITTVSVERYFKGHGGPLQIQVSGKEDTQAVTSIDFSFEEGKRYLLFLKTSEGNLKTNACMGNKEVSGDLSAEDKTVLGSGYSPNDFTQDLSSSEANKKVESPINTSILLPIVGGALVLGVVVFALHKRRPKSSR